MLLRAPVLGLILRKIAVARFCRTLSTLISSGVPILDGLDITARTAGNAVVEDGIMNTRRSIERGETIAVPLKETGVFPPMVSQMIGVGEATGALDTMLSKIADFYEEEVDTAVAGLLTLLEPLMIGFLGGVVGGIVIAMYLPIFSLISKLTGLRSRSVAETPLRQRIVRLMIWRLVISAVLLAWTLSLQFSGGHVGPPRRPLYVLVAASCRAVGDLRAAARPAGARALARRRPDRGRRPPGRGLRLGHRRRRQLPVLAVRPADPRRQRPAAAGAARCWSPS